MDLFDDDRLWVTESSALIEFSDMMTPEQLAQLPADRLTLIEATPDWVDMAYATAVFAGTIGSLLLLFGRGLAVLAFMISFAAILAQHTHTFILSRASEIISDVEKGIAFAVIGIGLYLVVLSIQAKNKGWIG